MHLCGLHELSEALRGYVGCLRPAYMSACFGSRCDILDVSVWTARAGRLEELSEARQGMVARVKASERDREGLEGAKAAAEAYLAKDRECTATHAAIYQLFLRDGQVSQPLPETCWTATPSPLARSLANRYAS